MRRGISWLLVFLGAFLLVAGLLALFYAGGAVKKTPLDVDTTTHLAGQAEKLNPSTGNVESFDVAVASITETDADASTDDVVAFVNTTCVNKAIANPPDCVEESDNRLVSITVDTFAEDRVSAEAISDPSKLPEGTTAHEGLVNKWPFDSEKKDYTYWDGLLGQAVPAVFDRVEELDGLETYVYKVTVPETDTEIADGIDGIYSSEKEIYVEPATGAVVQQKQHEVRTLPNGDPVIELTVEFTPDQVSTSIADAKDNLKSLRLLTTVIPLVGIIGGLILLAAGIVLLLLAARSDDDRTAGVSLAKDRGSHRFHR